MARRAWHGGARSGRRGARLVHGVGAGTLVLVLVQACVGADAVRVPEGGLRIATGGPGGVYRAYGEGLATVVEDGLPGAEAEAQPTAASIDNLRRIADGRADVGFTLADSAALAIRGEPPFAEPQPVAALARIYDNLTHLVVRADGGITDIGDLKGRTVSTGDPGSGTELVALRLLETARIDVDRDLAVRSSLGVEASAGELRSGRLDAFFWSGGLPTAAVADLATRTEIRLVDLSALVAPLRQRHGEFYAERSIPASTYALPRPVATIGVPNYVVASAAMEVDLAYALTRFLFDEEAALSRAHPEAGRVNRRSAIATFPVPLHPGAVRYDRETKL